MSFITSTRRSSSVGLSSTSGDEVTVTVAGLSRLGMHQRSPTADVVGGASRATMSLCMYHSPVTGKYYVFDGDSSGTVQQWELFDAGGGTVSATNVRQFKLSSVTEGCVADDVHATLYVSQEDVALCRYGAEPGAGTARTQVDAVGPRVTADIEGLTIYYRRDGTGYLVASSQGDDSFAVYQRAVPNTFVTKFRVAAGTVDGVTHTDGLDVTNAALGAAFPGGLLITQDDANDGSNQNFKLVPWERVAVGTPTVLAVDTDWDPRSIGR